MAVHSKPRSLMGMLLTVFILLQVAVAFQHNAHKHPAHRSAEAMEEHFQDTRSLLIERANNVAIKGASDSSQYPRIEIRDMIKKTDQWNLFLLAMERFKNKDKNDRLSYYQICGIHGRPFVAWNGQSAKHTAGSCPHNSAMFGSWHRPYLALYEQAVYQNAQEVIATFPSSQQQKWKNALVGLRIPYYDWAMDPPSGQPNVPASITDQTVTVTKPSGRVSITNPLYSYSFGSSLPSEMGWGPHNGYPVTLRHPVDNPTRSNNAEMNAVFGQARVGWRQRVFALFASKKNWGLASNSQYGVSTSRSNSDSYESIHDEIHGNAGGNDGHMSYLDVAAFDPMFWLHHANVDRLLTMHQWLATNTWVVANTVTRDTMYSSAGDNKDQNSPLLPFTKDTSGSYFTSTDVIQTRALGYYYPETANRQYSQVIAAINKLYGAGERAITKRDSQQDYAPIYPGRAFKAGDYDTVLDIVGDKWALPGSYQVQCFLGNKPASNSSSSSNSTVPSFTNSTAPATNGTSASTNTTGTYGYPSNFVGSHTFLGGSVASNNGSGTTLAEGCIPLTAALQGKEASGELKSLNPDDVEPYLKDNLWYKIVGPGGKEYQPEEIPSFHVKVKSCEVTPAASDEELPTYHEYIDLPRVNLPATKPWTYTPTIPQPSSSPSEGAPGYTSYPGSSYPTGAMPWDEPGYCVSHQTIKYVDTNGNYLYSESH